MPSAETPWTWSLYMHTQTWARFPVCLRDLVRRLSILSRSLFRSVSLSFPRFPASSLHRSILVYFLLSPCLALSLISSSFIGLDYERWIRGRERKTISGRERPALKEPIPRDTRSQRLSPGARITWAVWGDLLPLKEDRAFLPMPRSLETWSTGDVDPFGRLPLSTWNIQIGDIDQHLSWINCTNTFQHPRKRRFYVIKLSCNVHKK